MSKKAKKGAGKTEEERLLQRQQRAQAEEEMARKKEETLTLYLKDKLQKEHRNMAVNLLKLNEGWRTILRQTRDGELRRDVAVLRQTFERQLDELNFIIQRLVRDLQEAACQAAQVQRSHLQHVQRLWAQQDARLRSLQQRWESGLQGLSATCGSEKKQMLAQSQQQQVKMQDYVLSAEQQNKDVMEEIQELYEKTLTLYLSFHKDMEFMKNRKELQDSTVDNLQALQLSSDKLKELDQQISRDWQQISTDLRNMRRLKEKTTQLREQMISSEAENNVTKQNLTDARVKVNQKCHKLRDQLAGDRQAARKQLTELTVQGDAAMKKLQAVITKGEKLLRVAEMCRKLEDKHGVLSSSSSSLPAEEHRQVCEFEELQQLQQRLNATLLHREALRKHREDLSRENEQLELLLTQHADGLHEYHNPLMASQAPTTSVPPGTDKGCYNTVIEAAHAVRHL
ncbi:dynein regulatory complex subunit 2 [Leuresthes tenuis]|uniref:dynein regulatory complex subunit 2 n=1 Tax=Leuresthes tenuis TaxID=355514 RepID=UPI003B50853D